MTDHIETPDIQEKQLWSAVGGLEADYFDGAYPEADEDTRSAHPARGVAPEGLVLDGGTPQEMRALWITRWDFHTRDDISVIADKAAEANFNALFFQVRGNADALYSSQLEPWSSRLSGTLGVDPGWDPLALAVEEAHAARPGTARLDQRLSSLAGGNAAAASHP